MPEDKKPGTNVAKPAPTAVGAPIDWRARMKQVAVKTAEAEKPSGGFISFKSGRLSIGDQLMPNDKIECIVMDYLFQNRWYDSEYDSKKITSPACYAFGREEADLEPNPDADDPQGGPEGFCSGCEKNEWGSNPKGGRGKACANTRRLFLLPADVINDPGKVARTDFIQCDLPVTSVKNFSRFVSDLAPAGVPPFAVVVEMSVKPHDDTLFQVYFKPIEQIKNEAVLEALANRNWKAEQAELPKYPTKEELAERQAGSQGPSGKY